MGAGLNSAAERQRKRYETTVCSVLDVSGVPKAFNGRNIRREVTSDECRRQGIDCANKMGAGSNGAAERHRKRFGGHRNRICLTQLA